jgi:kynurenine formamidase
MRREDLLGPEAAYDDLPLLGATDLRHAWGVNGSNDELGTLNRVDDEATRAGVAAVRTGRRCSLDLPVVLPDPPLFERRPLKHSVYALDRNTWDDHLDVFSLQGSTQWDGLRHVRAREFGFYGGWQGPPDSDPHRLGVDRWAEHGMVSRGVLVDLSQDGELDPFQARAFSADELAEALAEQCPPLRRGDVLCIRFGWTERYLALDADERAELAANLTARETRAWAGLAGSEAIARFLWDNGIAAVVCDNPAVEVAPGDASVGDLHRRLIPCLGFAIGELFHLGDLHAACTEQGQREFLFVSVPLRLPGGVGSPGNAVAVL